MEKVKRLLIILVALGLITAGMVFCVQQLTESPPPDYNDHAISNLRTIESAQTLYHTRWDNYATLKNLGEAKLIDKMLASGKKDGFCFQVDNPSAHSWSAVAWPLSPGEVDGRSYFRSFYISKDGIIRYRHYTCPEDPLAGSDSYKLEKRLKND